MGTRAQAFTAKIKNLQDLQLRLVQGSVPQPQGHEIANSLKYFSSTLLGVLRDVPGQPMVMMRCREKDNERLSLFPSLDYKGLYSTLLQFLDLVHLLPNGLYDFGRAFLTTLSSLVPFLERELIDTLPYVVASTVISFPVSLVEDVVDVLCWNLLPFTITDVNHPKDNCVLPPAGEDSNVDDFKRGNYASNSTAAILMMVYQFAKDNSAIHRKITECFMSLKEDVTKDLLCVIAHGTPQARGPAANLLFYYWPSLNPTHYDRRNILSKFNASPTWKPPSCCNPGCSTGSTGSPAEATKVCLDHTISLSHRIDVPPPSYYCTECYTLLIRKSNSAKAHELYEDIIHPIIEVDTTCENKNCRSNEKMAVAWCFSCAFTYNNNRPMRLCNQCNKIRHNTRRGADHVVHACLSSPWEMEAETQNYLVKAVVGLLQEAVPFGSGKDTEETHRRTLQVLSNNDEDNAEEDEATNEATLNERRLLSRYGVWLLVGICSPTEDTTCSTFGHMLSMLFQWFSATAYLPNDKTGTALEKLKSEYLPEWLRKVYASHREVFVNCLLPNPPDYAKVGGHWDIITTRTNHIKEGLVRFFCLIPFDVITLEMWNKAMVHWMEAINQQVKRDELLELQTVFCKIFDPDMSPLGFDAKEMYEFIAERFKETNVQVQRQALQWLQLLCVLNVHIPLNILFDMFNEGIKTLHKGPLMAEQPAESSDLMTENKKPKFIVEVTSGGCLDPDNICSANRSRSPFSDAILETAEDQQAEDSQSKEEIYINCFNLMIDVLNGQLEVQEIELQSGINGPHASDILELMTKVMSTPWLSELSSGLEEFAYLNSINENPEPAQDDSITIVEQLLTDLFQLVHGTLKKLVPPEESENDGQDDLNQCTTSANDDKTAVMLKKGTPGLGGFMAVLSTLQSTVEKPTHMEESDSESSHEGADEDFEVKVEEYSIPLQLVYYLLVRNAELSDADMRYYLLDSVHILAIQSDVLSSVAKSHKRFIHWCQESLLTGIFWHLLESSHSQVAQVSVPLLMHSASLPGGADVLWKALDDDFHSQDWRIRYEAVEKVTVMFRFLPENVCKKNSASVKSVLSHAFCCIIACTEDMTAEISQQATLFLGTIHDSALKTLISCLEHQFDTVPIDRPIILKRLYQLFNCLMDRKVLTWSFFVSRFDLLINEIRNYESHQKHVNESVLGMQKESESAANEQTNSTVRSLSANLKYPYKRTVSAPGGMGLSAKVSNVSAPPNFTILGNSNNPFGSTSNRQQSAPILKNKNSKEHLLSKQVSNVATVIDELEYINIAAKTMDIEEVDKETIHRLVFLFMQFLSHAEQCCSKNDKADHDEQGSSSKDGSSNAAYAGQPCGKTSAKAFQSLYTLLGFNENECRFTTMPYRIRCTPAINAFMNNLPQVLDNNFAIGKLMLVNVILIMQKIPFPPRYATTWQHAYTLMQEKYLFQGCGFSLWHLEPPMRKNWLNTVMVIAYKYAYGHDEAKVGEKIVGLLRIIIHTLAAQAHVCDRYSKPTTGVNMRSRDLSSVGGETDQNLPEDGTFQDKDDESDGESDNEESAEENETNVQVVREPPKKLPVLPEPLPLGWAMQRLPSGRILFVDNKNQVTTWIDPRTGKSSDGKTEEELGLLMESPPSPLSLMDVITVGSPVNLDSVVSESSSSSVVTVTGGPPMMSKPPQEERLLPIGPSRQAALLTKPEQERVVFEKFWQVLNNSAVPRGDSEMIPLIEEKLSADKVQIVANIQKQDSVDVKEVTTTECYVGTVTHFRNNVKASVEEPVIAPAVEQAVPDPVAPEKKKKKRKRKMGTGSLPDPQGLDTSSKASSLCGKKTGKTTSQARMDSSASLYSIRDNPLMIKQSSLRVGEESICDRCTRCGMPIEEYNEDEIGLCITVLEMFISEEPSLVAPLLPEILLSVTRIARNPCYSWELDSSTFIPSNFRSIARQFMRCVLHQLSGNGIFSMIFHMDLQGSHRQKFFNTIVQCLLDFNELNPSVPVATFFQEMNDRKSITADYLQLSLPNLASYLSCIPFEQIKEWGNVFPPCDQFLRRLWTISCGGMMKSSTASNAPNNVENNKPGKFLKGKENQESNEDVLKLAPQIGALFDIFCGLLRMPGIQNHRFILEPMSKLVSHSLQNFNVPFHNIVSICHLCNKVFTKERDKLLITRTAVFELIQALKFKTIIPDSNFLVLTNLVLQDAGGCVIEDIEGLSYQQISGVFNTGASEVMRNSSTDILDFLADVHTLSKVKSMVKGMTIGVNEDTLGAILKASIAQFIALEITKSNSSASFGQVRESRSVNRYLPWLSTPPANTAAQGPREFLDCVAHIRLLSWLLLGSVNHTLQFGATDFISQPIPLDASCHIADHIQVILAGFAELSKTSVVHMCSLFHAFILCQLWTVYLEQIIALQQQCPATVAPPASRTGGLESDGSMLASGILLDFWGKVTPGILQLVSHSKVLAEMVNLHFLGLMEALVECNSIILIKLLPLWTPVLYAFHVQLPDHVKVRLQAIQDFKPTEAKAEIDEKANDFVKKWLQRMQFKMGQIEMQASNVTQFFTV